MSNRKRKKRSSPANLRSQNFCFGNLASSTVRSKSFCQPFPLHQDSSLPSDYQTFDEYVDMGQRPPNEEGTGRITFKRNSKLGILVIGSVAKTKLQQLDALVHGFIGLRTKILKDHISTDDIENEFHITDTDRGLAFPVKTHDGHVEVFSLFNVFDEYIKKDITSILVLTDFTLCEEDDAKHWFPVLGRACGDGIAIVCHKEDNWMESALHEVLHTVGVDHCYTWTCMMNEDASDDFSFYLCPLCLGKLAYFMNGESSGNDMNFLRSRFLRLEKLYKKFGRQNGVEWVKVRRESLK